MFDYAGIGVGLLALHHPGRWDVKLSAKRNPFTGQRSLFARDSREADNYIFWATYRPLGKRQPVSLGLGYSARPAGGGPGAVREFYLAVGVTLPDLVRAVAPNAARYFEVLGVYYVNVNLRATVK